MIRQRLGGWGMSFDFTAGKLGDFIELKRGYDLPQAQREHGPFPLVSSSGVTDRHSKAMVRGPGVITGRYGTIGQVFYVTDDFWPLNTTLYVRDFKGNDPKFISYFLRTVDFFSYSDKAAVPGVNRNHLHEAQMAIPNLAKQLEIASFLGVLDDRITLLRDTNATLEAIAQALFKSWFVDFDPVRAKMAGRAPEGMDEATAALFPDGFDSVESELIPSGWELSTLADVVNRSSGSIQTGPFGSQLHASDYVDDGVPVVMPKDIQGRTVNPDTVARTTQENVERLARHKLKSGDIVFSRRGDVERHALITTNEIGWLCGTGCLLVRPGPKWPSPTFLSMLLDAPQARTWLVQHAVGATMPNLNTGILGSVPVVVPPPSVLLAFEQVVGTLELRRSENTATAQTLTTLRDTLLPRLISGQLRLPEAEAMVDEVAA
jgi:type I restriction enzyme, S subunit